MMGYVEEQLEYADDAKAKMDRPPQVREQLDRLTKHCHLITELANALETRLQQVLRPDEPKPAANGNRDVNVFPGTAPIAMQVMTLGQVLDEGVATLNRILERLEV